MSDSGPFSITMAPGGRVTLPQPVRRALGWKDGARLIVERTSDGILLKPVPTLARSRVEDVSGCLPSEGAPRSLAEMEAGVLAEARRRHTRT